MADYSKFPRTYHLKFSEGIQNDDKIIKNLTHLENKEVVVTLKMDGENTTLYDNGYTHARSIDSKNHWSRDIIKNISSHLKYYIPTDYRICCENLSAKHSIFYPDGYLEGPLYLLSVWNNKNECLSWKDTCEYAELLDLPLPKVLYKGVFNINILENIANKLNIDIEEGFVVRDIEQFKYEDYPTHVAKYVRKNHVQPESQHWLQNAIPNGSFQENIRPSFLLPRKKHSL